MSNIFSRFLSRRSFRPTKTVGVGGTEVYGGYIVSKEKDARLVGDKKYTTYSSILANVSIVAAGVRYYLNLIAKPQWKVEPADDSSAALEAAEFVEHVMQDMTTPWHRVVRRSAMYRFYGFSVQEWTAKRRQDGQIGYLDIEARPQSTITQWDTDPTGTVLGMVQRSPVSAREVYLPRNKVVYIVDDSLDDSPEGLGLFRHIVKAASDLQAYEALEAIGFETDLRGIPIGRAPLAELRKLAEEGTITEEQRKAIEQPLIDFIQNHIRSAKSGVLLDSVPYVTEDDKATPSQIRQWDLELLKAGSNSQDAVAKAIHRKSLEIARILGVEHLLLGADGKGSLALSRDKTHSFFLIVDAGLKDIVSSYKHDFLGPLWELNGWKEELKPDLKTEVIQFRDIEQVTGALRDMAQAGAVLDPNDPAINEVRDLLGLSNAPEFEEEEDASLLGPEEPEDDEMDTEEDQE